MSKSLLPWAAALFIAATSSNAWSQAVPYEPGRYSWKVDDGEIQLIAARYTNRNSFDERAYTFYFAPSGQTQVHVVPVNGAQPGCLPFQ